MQSLEQHGVLGRASAAILERCCGEPELFRAGDILERTGAPSRALLVLAGWVSEERTLSDGRRQILRLLAPGDVAGLRERQAEASSDLAALSDAVVADVTPLRIAISEGRAGAEVARAWRKLAEAQEESVVRHIVRLGRLSALERTGQLLLELFERLSAAGLAHGPMMPMPLTQEQLSDHLGLSVVHLNRTLQLLRRDGFIESRHRQVVFKNLSGLANLCHHRRMVRVPLALGSPSLRPYA
jgi:CRP-like cAMP-binding protein